MAEQVWTTLSVVARVIGRPAARPLVVLAAVIDTRVVVALLPPLSARPKAPEVPPPILPLVRRPFEVLVSAVLLTPSAAAAVLVALVAV